MSEPRRCFVLGAGFSKAGGLPLARELTPVIWRARARDDAADTSPRPRLVAPGGFGYERVKADHDAIKMLFPSCDCDPDRDDSWPDFEQLITALDEMSRYQTSFERITHKRISKVARRAKKSLMHYLQQ